MEVETGRKLSDVHEARWLNLAGFCLRPGYGLAVDDWRVAQTWRLYGGRVQFVKNELVRAEWWILWRRLAGGLSAGQQQTLAQPLLGAMRDRIRMPGSGGRNREPAYQFGPHETAEVWRCLGSMELLAGDLKAELAGMALDLLAKDRAREVHEAALFALGRFGARVRVYAPLNALMGAEVVEGWLVRLMELGSRGAFAAAGASGVAVPVDEEGLVVREGRRLAPDARVAFVTPSRQLPLGVALSLARRLELLEWAGGSGSWIFEDDYDSEFRYVGRPLGALHGLDAHGCVIYAGTFSKVTFPSVRLGYLVVPPALVDVFAAVRSFADFSPPWLTQAVMTDFMTGGHFERHIRRMRALYKERQDTLVAQGRRELAGVLDIQPSDAGMTLLAWLPPGVSDVAAAAAAREHRVDVLPLSSFCGRSIRPGLLLGYAGVREREIKDATVRLAQALEPFRHRRSA